ncbi:MAG: PrgI family protein [Anaerostipes sp.]|nr:PrgI family protein [Anaerostipes sp.]MDD3746293.1 PrgI family protein [Anaerostipes sp.]
MAYVSVPKDLTKVKNKVAFNLTKRQMICIGIAAAIGLPFYFLTRNVLGTSNSATIMVLLMLPAFMFAMYEKDGMHLEQVLMNIITVKFLKPDIRRFETDNLYEQDPKKESVQPVKKGGTASVRKKK